MKQGVSRECSNSQGNQVSHDGIEKPFLQTWYDSNYTKWSQTDYCYGEETKGPY